MENTQQKKGLHPLAWVGIGCAVLLVIMLIVLGIGGVFLAKKAGDVLEDAKANPEVVAARAFVRMNPEIEEVGYDEDARTMTIRNKETGETVTASFEDIKEGKLKLTGEDGEEITFSGDQSEDGGSFTVSTEEGSFKMGAGANADDLPDWVPVPDGVKTMGHTTMATEDGMGGSFRGTSEDSLDDLMKFYETTLKKEGYKVNTQTMSGDTGEMRMVTGSDETNNRHVHANIMIEEGQTWVSVTYGENKK